MATKNTLFPIVGIGASADGIAALEDFFRGIPADSGMAFVVVTHLNTDRESALPEILSRYTPMRVAVATDGAEVAPNTVLVMPADGGLTIADRRLHVAKQTPQTRECKPIDVFLASLAKDQHEYAASVILSGGDGTLGTQAIKERGGLTFAQTADGHGPQPEMLRSAFVDFAIPADDMGARLVDCFANLGTAENLARRVDPGTAIDPNQARDEIHDLLREQVGHDFSGYKSKTFLRRVGRRMQVHRIETIDAYVKLLHEDPREISALFRDLLINVTNFFRDAEAFDKLATEVIPQLFEGRGAQDTIRIWVPGCASGEEVYSIAMLMCEQTERISTAPQVQIFATDIDENALAVARAGRYPEALLDSVSPERRRRFFRPDGSSHVLTKDVRGLCVFSPHSVLRDPPFSRLDLVSCRNLLIYLGPGAQKQVIPVFHSALRPGGFLFLGTSENVSQFPEMFVTVDKKARIFRNRENSGVGPRLHLPFSAQPLGTARNLPERTQPNAASLRDMVQAQVLDRHAPAHVVVTREGHIVHYSARTGKYLEPAAGSPSRQILNMARKDLRLDLRALLHDAVETNARASRSGLAIEANDGRMQPLSLTVEPIPHVPGAEPLYLVLFADEGAPVRASSALKADAFDGASTAALEQELHETRDRLQSMIEEYETALEEIRSSNEELVSVNEELQSSNEELEASKEELQSLNEELRAVNAELFAKVEALDLANNDLVNLFESTEIATIFLDTGLAIRSFTPAVSRIFSIRPGDYGRPITDLTSKFVLPTLERDLAAAFADGKPLERRIRTSDGAAHFLMRITPYRAAAHSIDGVVVSFVDITSLTEAEARQHLLIAELQHRTRNLLAVVRAIASQTLLSSSTIQEFEGKFNDRLGALSRVQSLLSAAKTTPVTVGGLIRMELDVLNAKTGEGRVTLSDAEVVLDPTIVRTLSLALHELATNALKHGALATDSGSLAITWRTEGSEPAQKLRLEWIETNDPPLAIDKIAHPGFGTELIKHALPYQLGAETEYQITPQGVRCVLVIPLHKRGD